MPADRICCSAQTRIRACFDAHALAKDIQASSSMLRDSLRADMGESLVAMKKEILSEIKVDISAIQPDIKEMKAEVAQTRKEVKTKPPPKAQTRHVAPLSDDVRCQIRIDSLAEAVRSTVNSPQGSINSPENAKVGNVLSFVESPKVTNVRRLGT